MKHEMKMHRRDSGDRLYSHLDECPGCPDCCHHEECDCCNQMHCKCVIGHVVGEQDKETGDTPEMWYCMTHDKEVEYD